MVFELGPAGEAAMRLVFTEVPQPALTRALLEIENRARQRFGSTLTDSVIGYTTLTLFFSASNLERDRTEAWLREQADAIVLRTTRALSIQQPMLCYQCSIIPASHQTPSGSPMTAVPVPTTSSPCTVKPPISPARPDSHQVLLPRHPARGTQTPRLDTPRATACGGGRYCRAQPRSIPANHQGDGGSSAPVPSRF